MLSQISEVLCGSENYNLRQDSVTLEDMDGQFGLRNQACTAKLGLVESYIKIVDKRGICMRR